MEVRWNGYAKTDGVPGRGLELTLRAAPVLRRSQALSSWAWLSFGFLLFNLSLRMIVFAVEESNKNLFFSKIEISSVSSYFNTIE